MTQIPSLAANRPTAEHANINSGVSKTWISATETGRRIAIKRQSDAFARALRLAHPQVVIEPRRPVMVFPKKRDYLWLASPAFAPRTERAEVSTGIPREIVREVAARHGLTIPEMISPRRNKYLVRARWEAAWRLARETPLSLAQIGRRLGNRDHTTILYSIRKHEARMRAGQG